jgi:maltose alpha-D-glucosyltransferase/alpha-amylase
MQWSADRNAGFSTANPQSLDLPVNIDPLYHYEKVNVADQEHDPSSLLRTTRQVLTLRSRNPVFGRGDIRFLPAENGAVLAFVRTLEDESILVVANLSRAAQYAELDLSDWMGHTPVELFGRRAFPPIGDLPYLLTLAPYGFYWFALERRRTEAPVMTTPQGDEPPLVTITGGWDEVLQGRNRPALASALRSYLVEKRWFAGRAREVLSVTVQDTVPLIRSNGHGTVPAWLAIVRVEFNQGEPSTWSVPLALAAGDRAEHLVDELRHGVVATVRRRGDDEVRVLHEALWEPAVSSDLLVRASSRRATRGNRGEVRGAPTPELRELVRSGVSEARLMGADQSNTSLVYEDSAVLKLFRRLDDGVNPDLEIGRHLSGHPEVPVPRLLGAIEYAAGREEPVTLGIVQEFVRHEADGWTHVLNALRRYYDELPDEPPPRDGAESTFALAHKSTVPDAIAERMTDELMLAELLGSRTATLHRALADDDGDPAFAPQPVNGMYQRSLYQSMRSMGRRGLQRLRRQRPKLTGRSAELADVVLGAEAQLLERFEAVRQTPLGGQRIRIHGDFHLGQVLLTGRDVVILDFEGEPLRSIGERRLPRSPLQDVAGMLRSLHYATLVALDQEVERAALVDAPERMAVAEAWARSWYRWTGSRFLARYLTEAGDLLPPVPEAQKVLLDGLLLEKAMYEVIYELEHRPDWVWIPLRGLAELVDAG